MPRKYDRVTYGRGIYATMGGRQGQDVISYTVRVTVGGQTYEATLPGDSTVEELKRKRAQLEAHGRTETPRAQAGTLRADAKRYLKLVQHLTSWKDRVVHLNAWCAVLGDVPRHRITADDVTEIRERWKADGKSPKTINNHCETLRHLYHRLDGRRAPTPFDDVRPLRVPKTIIQRVSDELILAVDENLQKRERDPNCKFDGAKTRARFRVFVSTGKRPIEIMRAKPQDVDLRARVWVPRDAKGGFTAGVYLNDDMLAAWQLFMEADAWGKYHQGSFGKRIRAAGWPANVRPYQARHTTWITASERGIDLDDIAAAAGHRDSAMTRRMYVPVLNSRLQKVGEALNGRFNGWPSVVPIRGSAKTTSKIKRRKAR